MIYLASPYSHPDPAVRLERFNAVCQHAAKMMGQGIHVFSPIAHSHPIATSGELPGDWDWWQKYDRGFLEVCDEVVVLALRGWRESVGVLAEIEIARKLKKPVSFVLTDDHAEENPGKNRGL